MATLAQHSRNFEIDDNAAFRININKEKMRWTWK